MSPLHAHSCVRYMCIYIGTCILCYSWTPDVYMHMYIYTHTTHCHTSARIHHHDTTAVHQLQVEVGGPPPLEDAHVQGPQHIHWWHVRICYQNADNVSHRVLSWWSVDPFLLQCLCTCMCIYSHMYTVTTMCMFFVCMFMFIVVWLDGYMPIAWVTVKL